ncbi:YggS family pyridoxal phosphate-dependent enzyme [Rhodanobacter sp. C05]|uniref:YggS family pyridoxal phosphate-dependent enzyme n=1 Tax=Rhodanobacter sp. C05 TaxID=1945855 RepID=UPI000985C0F0|nr:YggS family pyridoxal phosphate-dependent enzyme [Rhodanobacter sp. C05]OOG40757.1 YggS family pyridoxal phosphate enzyme [Rhodanobacter sp. C05]
MSTETDYLAANWAQIRRQVDDACRAAARDPATVDILPVSKTFGPDVVRAAIGLGLHRFGENKVQEIRDKSAALANDSIAWVMIGHLQTNKAKDVARLASEVQSLDRLELAVALHRQLQQAGRTIDVLVQVKTSPEPSKYGLPPEQLPAFLDALRGYDSLRVRGLMTLAIHSSEAAQVRDCFRRLRELRDHAITQGHDLPRLSMGMSGDFPLAIAEGATDVRIGTAIFGGRATSGTNYRHETGM